MWILAAQGSVPQVSVQTDGILIRRIADTPDKMEELTRKMGTQEQNPGSTRNSNESNMEINNDDGSCAIGYPLWWLHNVLVEHLTLFFIGVTKIPFYMSGTFNGLAFSKGRSAGNNGWYHQILGFAVNFPFIQFSETWSFYSPFCWHSVELPGWWLSKIPGVHSRFWSKSWPAIDILQHLLHLASYFLFALIWTVFDFWMKFKVTQWIFFFLLLWVGEVQDSIPAIPWCWARFKSHLVWWLNAGFMIE